MFAAAVVVVAMIHPLHTTDSIPFFATNNHGVRNEQSVVLVPPKVLLGLEYERPELTQGQNSCCCS
jgi:hypothetical protein